MCGSLVAGLRPGGTGRRIDEVDFFHPRPPLKPIPMETLAQAGPQAGAVPKWSVSQLRKGVSS